MEVADAAQCLGETAESALSAVLDQIAGERASVLDVRVVAEEVEGRIALTLLGTTPRSDTPLVERTFDLSRADCVSAVDLLRVVLQRSIQGLPLESWTQPAPVPAPTLLPLLVYATPLVRVAPGGVELGAGGARAWSPASAWFATVNGRASFPTGFGDGYFQETVGMIGLMRQFSRGPWRAQGEVRAGMLLVSGIGFDSNEQVILPWAELVGRGAWHWRAGQLFGIEIAASPVRHSIGTTGTLINQTLAQVRVGVFFGLEFEGK